jgi:hypothetical protein
LTRDIDLDGRVEIVTSDYGQAVLRLCLADIIHDSGFE